MKLLQNGDSAYEKVAKRLKTARDLLHQEVAYQVTAPLREQLTSMPQDDYEDKKRLAKYLNAELNNLGLRICCPKTHQPALLIGDVGNDHRGRFQMIVAPPQGKKYLRTLSTPTLPELQFMPAPPRRQPTHEGHERIAKSPNPFRHR